MVGKTKIQLSRSTCILLMGLLFFSMSQSLLFTVLGPIIRELGLRESVAGWIISAAAVTYTLAAPFWGRKVDTWGRRAVYMVSMSGFAVGTLVFAYTLELGMSGILSGGFLIALLMVFRIATSVIVGGIQPSAAAYMADISSKENRTSAMAFIGMAFGFGAVLGPLFGGFAAQWGLLVPVYGSALLILLVFFCALFWLKEHRSEESAVKPARLAVRDSRVLPYLILAVLAFTCMSAMQQTTAFYLQDLGGLSAAEVPIKVGFFIALMSIGMIFAQGFVVQKYKPTPDNLLRYGFVMLFLAPVGFVLAPNISYLYPIAIVFGLGFGFINPGLTSGTSLAVTAQEQGSAAGMVGAAMGAGYIFGPVVGTQLYELDGRFPFVFISLLAMLALVYQSSTRRSLSLEVSNS